MDSEFPIEEMVYQDSEGVVFRARDQRNQKRVALRRYFVGDEIVETLLAKDEEGGSLFFQGLTYLQSLEVPGLRNVIAGGFDPLDATPYLITQWVEGETLESLAKAGRLVTREAVSFEAQVRKTLLALPEEVRASVSLEASEIFLSRNEAKQLVVSLTISPLRYFGKLGGMDLPVIDRQAALRDLKALFHDGALSSPELEKSSIPQLASAKQGSGSGLLWGVSVAALLVLGSVGTWLTMKPKSNRVELVVIQHEESPTVEAKPQEKSIVEEESLVEENEPEELPVEADLILAKEGPEQTPEPIQEEAPSEEIVSEESDAPEPEPEEEKVEVEVVVLNEEEDAVKEPEPAGPVMMEIKSKTYFEKLGDQLEANLGESLLLEGRVEIVDRSGSGKHWYLYFGGEFEEPLLVVFNHVYDSQSGDFDGWEGYLGKTLRIRGKAEKFPKGRGVALRLKKLKELEVLTQPREYQITQVKEIRPLVSSSAQLVMIGTLTGFDKSSEAGYLVFEETPEVRARFWMESELGQNSTFRTGLGSMKGKKVRVRGRLQDDFKDGVSTVIQLDEEGCVEVIAE